MSLPRSNAVCKASTTSLSLPASSPGDLVPSPAARLANPGDGVKRRVARSVPIGIGAGLQQECRELVMCVDGGQNQRAGARARSLAAGPTARLDRFIHVRSGL